MIRALALLFLCAALHSSALASPIDKARSALDDLRFEDAQQAAEAALGDGSRTPVEVAALYMLLGEVAASLGDKEQARAYFHNALSIDIDLRLPSDISPKIGKPFAAAQANLEGADPISLRATSNEDGLLIIEVVSDPANLVNGAKVIYQLDGEEAAETGQGRDKIEIELPENATDLRLSGIDGSGNRLTEIQEVTLSAIQIPVTTTQQKTSPAFYSQWEVYGGLALGLALGGTYFGYRARSIADELTGLEDGTEYSKAVALEDDGKKKALYANISFAGAGLLTIVSVLLYRSQDDGAKGERITLVPQLSGDYAGTTAIIRF